MFCGDSINRLVVLRTLVTGVTVMTVVVLVYHDVVISERNAGDTLPLTVAVSLL